MFFFCKKKGDSVPDRDKRDQTTKVVVKLERFLVCTFKKKIHKKDYWGNGTSFNIGLVLKTCCNYEIMESVSAFIFVIMMG